MSVTTGNVYFDQTDAQIPGVAAHGLQFVRSYNSVNVGTVNGTSRYGMFGPGWSHSYDKRISQPDAQDPTVLLLRDANGVPTYFAYSHDDGGDAVYAATVPFTTEITIRKKPDGSFERRFRRGGIERYAALTAPVSALRGRLTAILDPSGNTSTLDYDPTTGNLTTITDPAQPAGARRLQFVYVSASTIQLHGPAGLIATFTLDTATPPVLATVVYADGDGDQQPDGAFTFEYATVAGGRRLTAIKDGTNRTIESHEYYDQGPYAGWARTSAVSGDVEKLVFEYQPLKTIVTNPFDHVTTYEYGNYLGQPLVTKIAGPCNCGGSDGGTQQWTYDDKGRITSYTDGEGYVTTYSYDPTTGDLLSEERPVDLARDVTHLTAYTYWPNTPPGHGRLHTRQDPNGAITTYEYQVPAGPWKITEQISPGRNRVTQIQYSAQGKPQFILDPNLKQWELSHNAKGDLEWIKDPTPAHNQTSFLYDAMGRLQQVVRPPVTPPIQDPVTAYDTLGRVSTISNPDGSYTRFTYDGGGRGTQVRDALGRITDYVYDPTYGRLERIRDAQAPTRGETVFGYDDASNLVSLTDARGKVTGFTPDAFGRTIEVCYHPGATPPCARADRFTYDNRGRLLTRTDRKGVTTSYTHDGLGRLTSKTYSDGTPSAIYRYDEGASNQKGGLTSATSGQINLAWIYNLAGYVTAATRQKGSSLRSVTYDYDDAGHTAWVKLDGQPLVDYTWEDRGLLERIVRAGAPTRAFIFGYDAAARRQTLLFPNDVTTTYGYDNRSRLASIAATGTQPVTSFTYPAYDPMDNRLLRGGATAPSETYGYDEIYRLRGVDRQSPSEAYTYDLVGNRRTSLQAPTPEWTYNDWNQLTAKPGATFQYDDNGNLTQKAEGGVIWTYEWDAENRLKRVLKDGVEAGSYVYDALGRRAERLLPNILHEYVYDREDILAQSFTSVLAEGEFNDVIEHVYTHGPGIDEPLEVEHGVGVVWNYHADGLGSIIRLTDSQQTVVASHLRQYDAFGNPQAASDKEGYAYTGREWDPESGLYYYRARYYDPTIGRFIGEDPIRILGGLNYYSYVGNSPVTFADPTGLVPLPGIPGPVAGAIGDVVGQVTGALSDIARNFEHLQNAPYRPGIDKYYHCMATCEAKQRGRIARFTADFLTELREVIQEDIGNVGEFGGMGAEQRECDADRRANERGSRGDPNMPCPMVCGVFLR